MMAIIVFHPLRRTMSPKIHSEAMAAMPIEMDPMMVRARGAV